MTFNEFKNNVEQWAAERGIYDHSTVQAQALKAISEAGELADAVIKNDHLALVDAIGDVAVCLVNVAAMSGIEVAVLDAGVTERDAKVAAVAICLSVAEVADCALSAPECNEDLDHAIHLALALMRVLAMSEGTTLEACCDAAWDEIKDRKGRMVAGGAFVKDEDDSVSDLAAFAGGGK